MAKRGTTTFSATKVAKAGLAASAALQRILDLEKEVSKLRHHVSVLSKRNHGLKKEMEGMRERGEEEKDEEVASQKEPEPAVAETVAEPSESEEEAESVASSVAPMSTEGEGDVEVRKEVVFDDRMMDRRDRMSDEDVVVEGRIVPLSGYTPAVEEKVRTVVPLGPRGYRAEVPVGLLP